MRMIVLRMIKRRTTEEKNPIKDVEDLMGFTSLERMSIKYVISRFEF